MKINSLLYFAILILLPLMMLGQSGNLVENGSLEMNESKQNGWIFPNTVAMNHPDAFYAFREDNLWSVEKQPLDGLWYTGLVVRDDGSFEVLGQKLKKKLVEGKKYIVSFYLCMSTQMKSMSPGTSRSGRQVSFGHPVNVRFSIGDVFKTSRVIYETGEVANEEWKEYTFEFQPDGDVKYFWIDSAHLTDLDGPYNGNVFIDMVSIKEIE